MLRRKNNQNQQKKQHPTKNPTMSRNSPNMGLSDSRMGYQEPCKRPLPRIQQKE